MAWSCAVVDAAALWATGSPGAGPAPSKRPCLGEAFLAPAVGEQAVVPDFDKTLQQEVQAEPPQELIESESHHFALRTCGVSR
jgi:hypothetical protein